jgi:cytochrome P450
MSCIMIFLICNFFKFRFSDENKKMRDNESHMPFGYGPRHCIGMRFALLEIKVLLTKILSKFEFEICEKTSVKKIFFLHFNLKMLI